MTASATELPFAVYGTLRVGQPNAARWAELAGASCGWRLDGYRLVGAGRGFPYVIPDPTAVTVVDLIVPDPDHAATVLRRLDELEGVPFHYERHTCVVTRGHDLRVAWLYVPAEPERYADLTDVADGDWCAHAWARR